MTSERRHDPAERLADVLMQLTGDQNVRAIEAVAVALANRRRQAPEDLDASPDLPPASGLAEAAPAWQGERFELCRRIARRALRGSLTDLVAGADAFHRIDADPPWARRLLPVAVFGSFLFYRTEPAARETLPPTTGAQHDATQPGCEVERVLDVDGRRRDDGRE